MTLDKDFGELAVVRAMPHVGIIRLVEIPARQQGVLCHRVLERLGIRRARGVNIVESSGTFGAGRYWLMRSTTDQNAP